MTNILSAGASCEAFGHPSECENPVAGTVSSTTQSSVTLNGNSIATVGNAELSFNSHAHDYSDVDGCHENASHSLDSGATAPSVTINGSPVYLAGDGVATDPISGGTINITSSGNSGSLTKE